MAAKTNRRLLHAILTLYEQLKEGLWLKHLALHITKAKHSLAYLPASFALPCSSCCAPCHAPLTQRNGSCEFFPRVECLP